ncbi:MAG: lipopolysaccharide heptosyltransferase II [Pseudomonadales bacterium]|nr:lipopolysaccharide heptosyltransferase II [Pseudomonadales bacterium]
MSLVSDKVLIIAPAWVGDMVMSHVVVQQLLINSPSSEIHMLAPAATLPVAKRMPGVYKASESPFSHGELNLSGRRALGKTLQSENYGQAIVLPNSLKSALIPWYAKIKKRTGWKGELRYFLLNDLRVLNSTAVPLMVDRFHLLAMARDFSPTGSVLLPRLDAEPANMSRLRTAHGLSIKKPVVAICPGAEYGPSKKWPVEYFSELSEKCIDAGFQVWILGSPGDKSVAENILSCMPQDQSENLIDLTGRTSMLDAIDLIHAADVVVSNDSGLMHVACAVDTPVVCVYGSTTPSFTPPLNVSARVLQTTLSCRPCFERECPLGHLQCLKSISAAEVFSALQAISPGQLPL